MLRHLRRRDSSGWVEQGAVASSCGAVDIPLGCCGVEVSLERRLSGKPGAEGAETACLLVVFKWEVGGAIRRD